MIYSLFLDLELKRVKTFGVKKKKKYKLENQYFP